MPRDFPIEKTRDIGIIAHIDASAFGLPRNLSVSSARCFPTRGKLQFSPTPFRAPMFAC